MFTPFPIKPVLLILAIMFLNACGGGGTSEKAGEMTEKTVAMVEAPANFQAAFGEAVTTYLALKDALVEANGDSAALLAQSLQEQLTALAGESGDPAFQSAWKPVGENLAAAAAALTAGEGLEAQRTAFYPLSQSLIKAVELVGPAGESLYVQHCPMAFDNTGADWLSNSSKIYNPYFGDMMLHCGEVTKTFAAK